MKYLSVVLVLLVSCKSEKEKFIQTEFDKIDGHWKIERFIVNDKLPDSLRTLVKSGELLFKNCTYRKKNFSVCGAEVDINGLIYSLPYGYDYSNKVFQLNYLAISGDNPSKIRERTANIGTLLLRGD